MAVYSLKQYRKVLNKRIKAIERNAILTEKQAAKLMVNRSRQLAPRHTGETIRGIRRRKIKAKDGSAYQVESRVQGKGVSGFRQNMWTNRTQPHHRPRMWWNNNRPTIYGDGSHRTTGTPGWWNIATNIVVVKFPKMAITNTRKALRVK